LTRPRVRLVATDLDGTLLGPSGSVGARTMRALARARTAGLHVVPITARPPHATYPLTDPLGLDGLGVCVNGAIVVDLGRREVLSADRLDADACDRLVADVRRILPAAHLAIDAPDEFLHEPGFLTGDEGWDEVTIEVDDVLAHTSEGVVKLVVRHDGFGSAELMLALEAMLGREAHATTSHEGWVELSAFGVTKAFGLLRVCERLDVPIDATVAVGDGLNDLSMLAAAGVGYAMANAHPDVLAAVDHILPTNADEGVATLLEEILGPG
jgi:Cof subfamily protein (haloacid dehalogenase superfamily)